MAATIRCASCRTSTSTRSHRTTGRSRGRLWGGCIEVLECLKGSPYWPAEDFWDDRILFLETSEEKPTVDRVVRMLRNYGTMGALGRIRGLLVGRARSYTPDEKRALDEALDFGHTDPQWILPLGVTLDIDCTGRRLTLVEPAVE